MNRYALFLLTDKLSDECKGKVEEFVKKVLRTEVVTTHRLSEACKVFTSFISLVQDQENGNDGSSLVAAWKLLPIDWHEKLPSLNSFLSEGCTYSNIPDLVQALHNLCNALRRPGPQVELFWLRSDACEVYDDDIELYGCMKRLQLWHNAIVNIIIPNGFSSSSHGAIPHHFHSLRPTILSLNQALQTYQRPVWNGSIAVTGSTQVVQLPGLRLDACAVGEFIDIASPTDDVTQNKERFETGAESDIVLSSCMKFVASVEISDVPIVYISSISYKISLTSTSSVLQQSDNFLSVLKDAKNTGYILRLEYGEVESEERVTGRESKTRRSWSDFLKEHYNNGYDDLALSGEFERVIGCHSFLVCAVSSDDFPICTSNPSTQESKEVIFLAYRLRSPSELNGSPMHQLTLRMLEKNADEEDILDLIDRLSDQGRSAIDHLDKLPHFSTKTFGKLMHNLRQAQLLAVQRLAVQDELGTISGVEFARVLLEVRTAFWENVLSKHSRKECHSTSDAKYQLQNTPMPEYRLDPYLQPERQILMLKASDSTSAQSKSFLHSGTLATLSPPTNNQVAVTLDAAEMLKYFNPDGSAVASDSLVKVSVKKRRQRLYHYDRGEARSLPWPECAQARYHDVYYNISVSEDLEKKCQQLRGRLGTQETSSTFGPAQTFLLPAKAGNERQKLPSFPGHQRVLSRRNSSMIIETKTQKTTKLESSLSSRRMSAETKSSLREIDSSIDSNSCDSNSQLLRGESRSQRNRRRLEEVIREMLETTCSIGPTDPLFKPCFKRLYTITETFVRDLPTSRDLRENMTKIARSHVRQTVKFEKERQRKLPVNGKNSQTNQK